MFGYVIPDKNNMYVKDFNVFQSYYCGLCRALGKSGGPLTRLCTNYDTTFYNVLLHSIVGEEPKFERKVCLINGKKKTMLKVDDLTKKVADISVLLVYYNAEDDVTDGKKSRLLIKWRLWLRKRAAAKRLPEADKLMKDNFSSLNRLEKEKCQSIDEVCDCTAALMRDLTKLLVKTNSEIDVFSYNLGRLVYLMDAVDDLYADNEKHRYNVLLLNFGECQDKKQYLIEHGEELAFLLNSTYNRMVESYNNMEIIVNEGVLSNTIYMGVEMQIDRLLKGEEKCQLTRL